MLKKFLFGFVILSVVGLAGGGKGCSDDSDDKQRDAQERILTEANSQTGMPAIKNFRERKILKDIYERRDQQGLLTYTYIFSEYLGKFVFVGDSLGYGIPASTQYSNPQKITAAPSGSNYQVIAQADPNSLFSPSSADGTWVMLKDGKTGKFEPQYIESRVSVFTFRLPPESTTASLGHAEAAK